MNLRLLSGIFATALVLLCDYTWAQQEQIVSIPMGKDVVVLPFSQQARFNQLNTAPQANINAAELAEQVDIAIFYRNQYAFYLGIDEVTRRIEDLVSYTNQAFADSDIDVELNLVAIAPASGIADTENRGDSEFVEDRNILTAFQEVTFDTIINGEQSFERDIIERSGADLFALVDVGIDTEFPDFAGIAFLNAPLSVSFDFGLPFRRTIFAHEIGHNFGGGHEIEDDPDSTRDNHAFECSNLNTILFSSVSRDSTETFSNPEIQRDGEFCGELGAADNTRNINASSTRTANFNNRPEATSTISFTQSQYTVNEQDGELVVLLSRTGNLSSAASVVVRLSGVTASAELDFFNDYQIINFEQNQNIANVSFPIVADAIAEATETATLELLFPMASELNQATATVNIVNGINGDPGVVTLALESNVTNESESVEVTLQRSGGSDGQVLYKLDFVPSESDDQGNEVAPMLPEELNRSLQFVLFADGETEKRFSISPVDDDLQESTEYMRAALYRATNLITVGNIAVLDNDSETDGIGSLSIAPLAESAFNNNRDSVSITINREGALDMIATAVLDIEGDGIAVLNDTLTATLGENETSTTLIVPLNETLIEQDTVINLTLSSPNFNVEQGSAEFTLLADEQGEFSIELEQDTVSDTDGSFTINLLRSGGSDNQVSARVFIDEVNVAGSVLIPAQSQTVEFADGESDARALSFELNDIELTEDTSVIVQLESSIDDSLSQLTVNISNGETNTPTPVPPATSNPPASNSGSGGGATAHYLYLLIGLIAYRRIKGFSANNLGR